MPGMRIARFLPLAFAALLAVAAAVAFWPRHSAVPQARFTTLAGESLSTTDLRGKVFVVEFWSLTCGICLKSMPRMVDTYRRFAPNGFELVAVAAQSDPVPAVAEYARRRALPFKVAPDTTGEASRQFGRVRLTPTTFLVDRQGRVLKKYVGEPDWAEFHALVEKALRS